MTNTNSFEVFEEKLNIIIQALQGLDNKVNKVANNQTHETEIDIIGIEDAAILTGYTVNYIYELKMKKIIPFFKVGKSLRFSKSELKAWITAGRLNILQQGMDSVVANHLINKGSI